jgi:hypothetical protein
MKSAGRVERHIGLIGSGEQLLNSGAKRTQHTSAIILQLFSPFVHFLAIKFFMFLSCCLPCRMLFVLFCIALIHCSTYVPHWFFGLLTHCPIDWVGDLLCSWLVVSPNDLLTDWLTGWLSFLLSVWRSDVLSEDLLLTQWLIYWATN